MTHNLGWRGTFIAVVLLASSAPLRGQGQPAAKVISGPGGVPVFVARVTATATPSTFVKAAPGARFRALSSTMKIGIAQAAGAAAPSTAGAFTLTTRSPFVEGRGSLTFQDTYLVDGESDAAVVRSGVVWLRLAASSPTRTYMLHFQVEKGSGTGAFNYHVHLPGGAEYVVPANATGVQDLVVLLSATTDPPHTMYLQADGSAAYRFVGVEVTPM